jgi:hypothetical protein
VWLQRPDASGARTPPLLEPKQDQIDGADDAEEAFSSISSSLKDSLGSLARRMHERTPPDSPRTDEVCCAFCVCFYSLMFVYCS